MKRMYRLIMVLVCVLMVFGFTMPSMAAEYPTMRLKATSWFPAGSFTNDMLEWFVQEIEKRTAGKVTFEKYWGGALLKGGEALEGLQHGVTDFGVIAPAYTPGKVPLAYSNYAFPFCPRSAATMASVVTQIYEEFPWMHDELTAQNVKLLYWGTVSDYGLLSRKPVKGLADMKGLKVVQLGGYFADWTKASGIIPVSGITSSERYERLRTGVVDASLLTPSFFVDYKEYEVAKNCIMVGLGARVPMAMLMNMNTWKKMSPELQKLFMDVGKEIQKRHAEETDRKMLKDLEILQQKGVEYAGYLSEAEINKWAAEVPDTAATMCKSLEGKYPDIWKMAHRFIEISAKDGHRWPRKFAVEGSN